MYDKKWRKVIPKKSKSKYVSALAKILNRPPLLAWRSTMSSIIFGPFRLLGNAHLFNWLFRWPVGVDMWCRSCRPEVRIRWRVRKKFDELRICWKRLKFERCWIRMQTSSHPYHTLIKGHSKISAVNQNQNGYFSKYFGNRYHAVRP